MSISLAKSAGRDQLLAPEWLAQLDLALGLADARVGQQAWVELGQLLATAMALLPGLQQGQQLLNAVRAWPGGVDMAAVGQGMAMHGGIRFAGRRSGGLLVTMIDLGQTLSPVTVRRN